MKPVPEVPLVEPDKPAAEASAPRVNFPERRAVERVCRWCVKGATGCLRTFEALARDFPNNPLYAQEQARLSPH
jgi:hypothetical protein